ncbi:SUR7/PalI family-domain-containing protein [Mycena maculata]|uniref:SUR7/PalI family-domain-containing protein n=1 Tax=Mycena maculata TaxID=230809 RepID=A0AAD7NJ46_9AGAR|nr:SUR7/PalI family-domain-containing protein [Mycena maculata]
MGCIRPATPGFILTTLATALLAVVSFCVPYFKSVFFLKADIASSGVSGTITFGTLGYCVEIASNTTCSKPSVGYELDINSLVGDTLPIQIPNVVVKWLTYVLVLHIVALALAAGSALFGLLAHVREMAMTCCSTFVSGLAAAVALVAFIFDIAFFFLAKARINAVGTASIGNAIWLTLAAWILLFFSGCFYTLGRCCISNRSNRQKRGDQEDPPNAHDQMRLDAVKAEADRKARQKATEGGLPAFHENGPESQPLTTMAYDDGSGIYSDKPHTPAGYMQAPPGSRAVDQYYNNAGPSAGYNNANAAYPPTPQRQYAPSTYAPSTYSYNAPQHQQSAYPVYPAQQYNSIPPLQHPEPQHSMSLPPQQPYHTTPPPQRVLSPPQQQYGVPQSSSPVQPQPNPYLEPNPYLGVAGHAARGTSYHSAVSHPAGEYSQYDPYDPDAQTRASEYYTPQGQSQYTQGQYSPQTQAEYSPHGARSGPPLETGGYFAAETQSHPQASGSTSPKGPRNHRQSLNVMNQDEESPPQYEVGGSEHIPVPGAWGKN